MYPEYIAPATPAPIVSTKSAKRMIQRPFLLGFSTDAGEVGLTGIGGGKTGGGDAGGGGSGRGGRKLAKPGAGGITPIILGHAVSTSEAMTGVIKVAIAPIEMDVLFATSALFLGVIMTILPWLSSALICRAVSCPSFGGRSIPKNTTLGRIDLYMETASSLLDVDSVFHPLCFKIIFKRPVVIGSLNAINAHGVSLIGHQLQRY